MLLLIGFAFLAGVVTVLSPCILPVLPLVLSGTVGGRGRPWGVITGFVVSFTLLTLFLSAAVQSIGLDPDVLRWTAAGIVALMGLVLVVPALKDRFLAWASGLTARFSRPGTAKPGAKAGGFGSGLVLGLGLGAVWTPCVGPIMASVISLALTQKVDAGGVGITLAYTLGTAVPMAAILFGGRGLLNRVPWLTRNSSGIQRAFGVLMLVTAAALSTGLDRQFSTWLLTTFPGYGSGLTALEANTTVKAELDKRRSAEPEGQTSGPKADPLTLGSGTWINSMPLTLGSLKGKVVLVDFWTYSCINCVRTLPYLRSWDERYRADGLVIVGVHSPEFAFEQSEANVRRAVSELKVTWPVVQDNAFGIWNAYSNQYWPAHYLYGRDGTLLETHFGEGNYAETEKAIAAALGVPVRTAAVAAVPVSEGPKTPETYLAYGRGQRFSSPEAVASDKPAVYTVPTTLAADRWAYGGTWTIGKESAAGGPGSKLVLRFQGSRVYLVAKPGKTGPAELKLRLDGRTLAPVKVDTDRMYTLVDQAGLAGGLLEIEAGGPVEVFAFTFG